MGWGGCLNYKCSIWFDQDEIWNGCMVATGSWKQRQLSWESCQEEMIIFPLLAEETPGGNIFPTKHNLNQTISQGKCRATALLKQTGFAALFGSKLQLQELGKHSVLKTEHIDSQFLWRGAEPSHFHNTIAKRVVHSVSKYLLSIYPVPCTILGAGDTAENKTDMITVLMRLTLLRRGRDRQWTNK